MINSDHLIIKLPKEKIQYLLIKSNDNFFTYLYDKTEYLFYKKINKKIFGIIPNRITIRLTKDEALAHYKNLGFAQILDSVPDTKFKSMFLNYELLLKFDKNKDIPILLRDLKLLLDMANITIRDFELYGKDIK